MDSNSGGQAAELLRSFRDRIVRLEEEKKAISDDIKEVYKEAAGTGFDREARLEVEAVTDLIPQWLAREKGYWSQHGIRRRTARLCRTHREDPRRQETAERGRKESMIAHANCPKCGSAGVVAKQHADVLLDIANAPDQPAATHHDPASGGMV